MQKEPASRLMHRLYRQFRIREMEPENSIGWLNQCRPNDVDRMHLWSDLVLYMKPWSSEQLNRMTPRLTKLFESDNGRQHVLDKMFDESVIKLLQDDARFDLNGVEDVLKNFAQNAKRLEAFKAIVDSGRCVTVSHSSHWITISNTFLDQQTIDKAWEYLSNSKAVTKEFLKCYEERKAAYLKRQETEATGMFFFNHAKHSTIHV